MTACKTNADKPVYSKAVGITLAGVMAVGMVPATALTAFADETVGDSGISTLAATTGDAFQNGTVTAATNQDKQAITDLSDITFTYSEDTAQYAIPTQVTPQGSSSTIDFSWGDFVDADATDDSTDSSDSTDSTDTDGTDDTVTKNSVATSAITTLDVDTEVTATLTDATAVTGANVTYGDATDQTAYELPLTSTEYTPTVTVTYDTDMTLDSSYYNVTIQSATANNSGAPTDGTTYTLTAGTSEDYMTTPDTWYIVTVTLTTDAQETYGFGDDYASSYNFYVYATDTTITALQVGDLTTIGDYEDIALAYTGETITPTIQYQTADDTTWTDLSSNYYTITATDYYDDSDDPVYSADDVTTWDTATSIEDVGWYRLTITPSTPYELSSDASSYVYFHVTEETVTPSGDAEQADDYTGDVYSDSLATASISTLDVDGNNTTYLMYVEDVTEAAGYYATDVNDSSYTLRYYAASTDDTYTIEAAGTTLDVTSTTALDPTTIIDPGTYYAVVTYTEDDGDYSNYLSFEITNLSLDDATIFNNTDGEDDVDNTTFIYTGERLTPGFAIDGKALTAYDSTTEEGDYTYYITTEGGSATTDTTVTEAGDYVAVLTGYNAYASTTPVQIPFTVEQFDLTDATIDIDLGTTNNPVNPLDEYADGTLSGALTASIGDNELTDAAVDAGVMISWVSGPNRTSTFGAAGEYTYLVSYIDTQDNVIGSQTVTAILVDYDAYWFYNGTTWDDTTVFTGETDANTITTILTSSTPNYFEASYIGFAYDPAVDNDVAWTDTWTGGKYNYPNYLTLTITDADGNAATVDDLTSTPGTYTVYATINAADLDYAVAGTSPTVTVTVVYGYITDANVYVSYDGTYAGTDNTLTIPYTGENLIPSIDTEVYGSASEDGTNPTLLTEGTDYAVTYYNADGDEIDDITNVGTYTEVITSDTYTLLDANNNETDSVTITITVTAAAIYGIQATGLETYDGYTWGTNTYICTPYTGDAYDPEIQFASGYNLIESTEDETTSDIADPDDWFDATYGTDYELTCYYSDSDVTEASEAVFGDTPVDSITEPGWYQVNVSLVDDGNYTLTKTVTVDANDTETNYAVPDEYLGTIYIYVYQEEENVFVDVPEDAWYYDDVYKAFDNGYMFGYANTDFFGPNDYLIRGQAAIIGYNMSGGRYYADGAYDESDNITTKFADCPMGAYYNYAINWGDGLGILTGYTEDGVLLYGPEDNILREQFATIMSRYMNAEGEVNSLTEDQISELLGKYVDGDMVSDWARPYVAWAIDKGIMGVNTDTLAPLDYITRAEAAAMSVRTQPEPLDQTTGTDPDDTTTTD
ncbi:MAG: S-layer homology domain-containing protein [Clostridia bacterium]|nr:S-layer homology domain-containing protein [Clostridia bacterium]